MSVEIRVLECIDVVAIPPSHDRRVSPQKSPPAFLEGLSARFGTIDRLFANPTSYVTVTAIATIDEIEKIRRIADTRVPPARRRLRTRVDGPSPAAGVWHAGSAPVWRWHYTPSSSSADCRTS